MLTKKKMATIAATGMVTVGLLVGGASFALFSDTTANSDNSFTAGTLTLDTHRHDVPIAGPMFYVNDSDGGRMGTGIWAPLDSHSRSMFIENTGSLDAKLTKLKASAPADTVGMEKFAEQAMVSVLVYETNGVALDESAHKALNEAASEWFEQEINSTGFLSQWRKALARGTQEASAILREIALDFKYEVNTDNGVPVRVTVSDVYVGPLKDMMGTGVDPDFQVELKSGKAMELGYTVTLMDHPDNNEIKNVTAKFNFTNEFQQVRNN